MLEPQKNGSNGPDTKRQRTAEIKREADWLDQVKAKETIRDHVDSYLTDKELAWRWNRLREIVQTLDDDKSAVDAPRRGSSPARIQKKSRGNR